MTLESNAEAAQRTDAANAARSNSDSVQSTQYSGACTSKSTDDPEAGDTCMLSAREEGGDVLLVLELADGFERITTITPEAGYRFIGNLERALDLAAIAGEGGGEEA